MKFSAHVISGHGRGKGLGFPTFNVIIPQHFDFKHGVYAAAVWINNMQYAAATHFGPVPSFNEAEPTLEFYVLDYADAILVTELSFEMLEHIRPIQKFDTPEQLSEQIASDVQKTRDILKTIMHAIRVRHPEFIVETKKSNYKP